MTDETSSLTSSLTFFGNTSSHLIEIFFDETFLANFIHWIHFKLFLLDGPACKFLLNKSIHKFAKSLQCVNKSHCRWPNGRMPFSLNGSLAELWMKECQLAGESYSLQTSLQVLTKMLGKSARLLTNSLEESLENRKQPNSCRNSHTLPLASSIPNHRPCQYSNWPLNRFGQ